MLKRVRHIKTITRTRPARIRMDIRIGSIPKGVRLRRMDKASLARLGGRRIAKKPLKTWVFTERPYFRRYEDFLGVQKQIAPPLDVFDEAEDLLIVAQVPGAAEKDIKMEIRDDLLTLEAHASTRQGPIRYYKEVLLPFEVEPSSIQSSFSEGILQLTLSRRHKKL
ncbi:MAG: Hsp20/alpha crystallin family protein [Candidatus Brocadiales bacterium]|nr:Hsp20/alpha crystallin family protein [Candidatus Brocadiales bacterium]